jgi:inner membrane protein
MIVLTHIAFALLVGNYFGLDLVLVAICSILPDIDTLSSPFGKLFKPLSKRIYARFGHRGLTHSLMFLDIATILGLIYSVELGLTILVGIGSHIFLDSLSYAGVQLLFPKRINYTLFDRQILVGSKTDWFIGITFIILFSILLASTLLEVNTLVWLRQILL